MNITVILKLVGQSTLETLSMIFFSALFATILGFPLGILLNITGKFGITPKPLFNQILSRIIDILRSFPFVILMIMLLPFTRLILGTAIGTTATIIPLSLAAMPFVARVTESAISDVFRGFGNNAYNHHFDRIFCDGRNAWRRWARRPCHKIRISTIQDGNNGCGDSVCRNKDNG